MGLPLDYVTLVHRMRCSVPLFGTLRRERVVDVTVRIPTVGSLSSYLNGRHSPQAIMLCWKKNSHSTPIKFQPISTPPVPLPLQQPESSLPCRVIMTNNNLLHIQPIIHNLLPIDQIILRGPFIRLGLILRKSRLDMSPN